MNRNRSSRDHHLRRSRLSPSLVFDIGLGNLFVSRIRGQHGRHGDAWEHEYAVAVLGVKLIVVLGHSNCGAASSAIAVANGTKSFPPDKYGAIGAVVGLVVRTVKSIPKKQRTLGRCTVKNARVEANKLASQGPIIKQAVDQRKLRVVAGVYDIGSGRVELV